MPTPNNHADNVIYSLIAAARPKKHAGGRRPQTLATGSSSDTTHVQDFFNAMTDLGDIIYGGANGQLRRLPIGSEGQVLKVVGGVPQWDDP